MEIGKSDNNTDIFTDIAGGNRLLRDSLARIQHIWQKHANRRTAVLLVILTLLISATYLWLIRAPENFPTNVLINIPEGETLQEISQELQNKGVVRSAVATGAIAKLYGVGKSIRYGDYLFKEPLNALDVVQRLGAGAFGLEPVTVRIREGATVSKIAGLLESKMLKFDKNKFIEIAGKYEGYLFPDTYYFLPNATEEQIVAAMTDNFYKHYAKIEDKAKELGYSTHQIVTLASILELEASKFEDRRKIAGVMYNRLERDMPLQVDVSFVYIMDKGSADVTLKDLKYDSPYNTYVYKGLPPGPIGSPSMESLQAVVDPVESDWLFYLADKRGVTHYSKTYKEHLRKKRWYIDKNK